MNSDNRYKEKKTKKKKLLKQNKEHRLDSQIAEQLHSEGTEELSHPVCNVNNKKKSERKRKLYNTSRNRLEDIEINGPSTPKKDKRNKDKTSNANDKVNEFDDTSQDEEALRTLGMGNKKKKKSKKKERSNSQSENEQNGMKQEPMAFNFLAELEDNKPQTDQTEKKKSPKKDRKERDIFITQVPVSQLSIPGTQPYSELSQDTLVGTQEVNELMKKKKKKSKENNVNSQALKEPTVLLSQPDMVTLSQFFSTQSQNTQVSTKHEIIDIDQDDADSIVELPVAPLLANSNDIDGYSDIEFIESSNEKTQQNKIKRRPKSTDKTTKKEKQNTKKEKQKAAENSAGLQDSIVIDSSLEGVEDKMSQPVCIAKPMDIQNESDDDFSFTVKKKKTKSPEKKSPKKDHNESDNVDTDSPAFTAEVVRKIEKEIIDDVEMDPATETVSKKKKKKRHNEEIKIEDEEAIDQDNTMENPEKETLDDFETDLATETVSKKKKRRNEEIKIEGNVESVDQASTMGSNGKERVDDFEVNGEAETVSKKKKKKRRNEEIKIEENVETTDQDNTMESPEKKFCIIPERLDELASSTKIWEFSVQVEPDDEREKPTTDELENIIPTDIKQVAPVESSKQKKHKKKKKRKEIDREQEKGIENDNDKENDKEEDEDNRSSKKKKKKKKKKREEDRENEDDVNKNKNNTNTETSGKKTNEKPKKKMTRFDYDQTKLKRRPHIEFDFENSYLKQIVEEKGYKVTEDLSRINSLYAKKIPRHHLLDHGKITTAELRKKKIQFTIGKWTNHELYLLLKNIKAAKIKYGIKNFKEFMTDGGNKTGVERIVIYREIAVNLLRPVPSVRKKLVSIYVTGEDDPEKHKQPFTSKESKRLLELVQKYNKDWKTIAREMDRSITSCQNKFGIIKEENNRQEKRKENGLSTKYQKFTPEEDKRLLNIIDEIKRENQLVRGDSIPWALVGQRLGTRDRRICRWRYVYLTQRDDVERLTPAERYALVVNVLRMLISQNIEEVCDVDWEKARVAVGFKGTYYRLRDTCTRFLDGNVDRALTTNQQRLDYLIANPSIKVIQSATKPLSDVSDSDDD